MEKYDVIIVGGGPAGAVCATVCARGGLRTLVLERTKFPRDKVCGDFLNSSCWPVFERLGVVETVLAAANSPLRTVEMVMVSGRRFRFEFPPKKLGEIGLRRKILDAILLDAAREAGAEVLEEKAVTRVRAGWKVEAGGDIFSAPTLVAADGRNSTVARLLGLLPGAKRDRVSLQTHLAVTPGDEGIVRMTLLPEGYAGAASIGDGLWNLCLVARPENLTRLKAQWNLPPEQPWNAITPLTRDPCFPLQQNGSLLLLGDAARVVEPFTGEGIYYALRTGELAGECLVKATTYEYPRLHRALYRGRLWTNQLARLAVLHPAVASRIIETLPGSSQILRLLTRKVTG